ncbi:hypothetical protein MMYC01_205363 [Madurella mycetomatis]|uniref:Prokaryotic-type class I peptide chain release factors domain-containing protein n=1 Tax=Madurella mycetomatis TaxID=100816 RepID=A0A175W2U1_9PEZI|nr:hypothetical protein MMYC01_205363 [Madurella mycetomatis]
MLRLPLRLRVLPLQATRTTIVHRHAALRSSAPIALAGHSLSTSPAQHRRQMPARPKPPPEDEIEESFLKGSGPGGQKINKTNSAVQLKHIPTGIVIKSQATRSRSQNRKIARDLLAAKLDELTNGAQSRTAIVGETKKKRAASAAKKSRRKYKKLAEEKEAAAAATVAEEGAGTDVEVALRSGEGRLQEQAQVINTNTQT